MKQNRNYCTWQWAQRVPVSVAGLQTSPIDSCLVNFHQTAIVNFELLGRRMSKLAVAADVAANVTSDLNRKLH